MEACCVGRRGQDEDARACECILRRLRPQENGAGNNLIQPSDDENDEEMEEQRSTETVQRHSTALGSEPNLLVYMVSDPPAEEGRRNSPAGSPSKSRRKQRAHHIPPNTLAGVPIDTESFVGEVIVMYRPAGGLQRGNGRNDHPYHRYFSGRKRNWEFRVQGRFKRIPKGDMFIGIVLRDFNYDQAVASHSVIVKRAGMALVKYELYLSWGDRCEASKRPDAELSHLVTNMTAWDQIIVTPKDKAIPSLKGELHGLDEAYGLNLQRKEMGLVKYTKAIEDVCRNINTDNTYTMCFWGVSQVIDALSWSFKIGTTISMARFFDDDPIHVAMYELEPVEPGQVSPSSKADAGRHLESRKRYYLDFMFWSNSVHCPRLPSRYVFLDAPEELEQFSSAHCSTNGNFVASSRKQVVCAEPFAGSGGDSPRSPGGTAGGTGYWSSLLASCSNKLRWIPVHTCSADGKASAK